MGELPWGGLLVPPNRQEEPHHSRVKYPHLIMIKTYGTVLFSLPGLCQYPVWSMLFFLWPPDLLRKLHPSSNSSPPIIANHYARTRLASGGRGREWGGGVICWGWSIMPMAPLHQDLDEILLGSKSHSTQHMPTLLYFSWSHWSHIKTYLITATCQEGVSIVIWNHFRWLQRHFMVHTQ